MLSPSRGARSMLSLLADLQATYVGCTGKATPQPKVNIGGSQRHKTLKARAIFNEEGPSRVKGSKMK